MKWTGNMARTGETDVLHNWLWWGDLREKVHLEDLGVNGRMMVKWIFKKRDGKAWNGLIWPKIGAGGRRLWKQ
jgi:hypothetical protein